MLNIKPSAARWQPDLVGAFTFESLYHLTAGRALCDVACPSCGPTCRSPHNRTRRVLWLWHEVPGLISFCCARCGQHGSARYTNATLAYDRVNGMPARASRRKPATAAT